MFATYIQNPVGMKFETQEADEKIVLLLRRHVITNVPWLLITALLATAPLWVPGLINLEGLLQRISPGQQVLLLSFYYLFIFGYAFEQFLVWFFSINIVTNKRLVDVDFVGLFYKQINEGAIGNVQDVSVHTGGALQLIFHYGTVTIQTEGPVSNVEFEDVPNPTLVQKTISKLVEGASDATDTDI